MLLVIDTLSFTILIKIFKRQNYVRKTRKDKLKKYSA